MKTIELPKWLFVVIVIIFVFAIVKFIFDKCKSQVQTERERLQAQLQAITEILKRQSEQLSALADKKAMLDILVLVRWRIFKALVGVAVLIVFFSFYYITHDTIKALSGTIAMVVTPLTFLLFLFSDGTKDVSGLMEYFRMKIQLHVYQKNEFNPMEMESLKRKIEDGITDAEKIETELSLIENYC